MDTAALAHSFATDLVAHRTKLAGKAEDAVRAEYALHQAAGALAAQHDAYHKTRRTTATHPSKASGRGKDVVHAARTQLGVRENPPGSNRNPYGPTAAWCSSFATAMWRKAGVKIPVLPFSGDVFRWGERNGHAY